MSGPPEFRAFAYGASRSGKTTYYSPVLLRPDRPAAEDNLVTVQGFLFLPDEHHPEGSLNALHTVHANRIGPLDHMVWDDWPHGLEERLERYTWEDVSKAEDRHPNNLKRASVIVKRYKMDEIEVVVAHAFVTAIEEFADQHGRAPYESEISFRATITKDEVAATIEERP